MAVPESPRQAALNLLSRREHCRAELLAKLLARGHEPDAIGPVLDALEDERLLSDARYAESYLRVRSSKGYGPQRIRAELRERGVDTGLIHESMSEAQNDWFELARQVREKRFGHALPGDFKERAKQMRFLQYRGFDSAQIHAALETEYQD